MKIKRILFLIVSILVIGVAVATNVDKLNYKEDDFFDMYGSLIDEANSRVEDYMDVDYAVYRSEVLHKNVSINQLKLEYDGETGGVIISEEQELDTLDTMRKVIDNLSPEEYENLVELGNDNPDVANLLNYVEFGEVVDSGDIKEMAVLEATLWTMFIEQGLKEAVILLYKGALALLKAAKYLVIPFVIAVAVVVAIATIAVVTYIYWALIKPIINKIIDGFCSLVSKAAKFIREEFGKITAKAVAATESLVAVLGGVIAGNNEVGQNLRNAGLTKEQLAEYIARMLGFVTWAEVLESIENGNRDKVLCIGRDSDKNIALKNRYNEIAKNGHHFAFWTAEFEKFINSLRKAFPMKNPYTVFDAINLGLVQYCCINNWDFILCTNPYPYMLESGYYYKTSEGGNGYSAEIALIRLNGYNNFTNGKTWLSLPKDYNLYGVTSYRVRKGSSGLFA